MKDLKTRQADREKRNKAERDEQSPKSKKDTNKDTEQK